MSNNKKPNPWEVLMKESSENETWSRFRDLPTVAEEQQKELVESAPEYKYNEGELIKQLQKYVDGTYGEHYSVNKFQATEFIIDGGHGEGFCIGNIMKYAQRYGKKDGYNRKDLMKVLHYALIALYVHDLENVNE